MPLGNRRNVSAPRLKTHSAPNRVTMRLIEGRTLKVFDFVKKLARENDLQTRD